MDAELLAGLAVTEFLWTIPSQASPGTSSIEEHVWISVYPTWAFYRLSLQRSLKHLFKNIHLNLTLWNRPVVRRKQFYSAFIFFLVFVCVLHYSCAKPQSKVQLSKRQLFCKIIYLCTVENLSYHLWENGIKDYTHLNKTMQTKNQKCLNVDSFINYIKMRK